MCLGKMYIVNEARGKFQEIHMYSYSVADFPFGYGCTGEDGQLRAGGREQVHPHTPR